MSPPPMTLTFDLLTLKVVTESRVTWSTSVPILVFLGLSLNNNNDNNRISIARYGRNFRGAVLDLGPMYATDRETDVRQHHCLMPPPRGGA